MRAKAVAAAVLLAVVLMPAAQADDTSAGAGAFKARVRVEWVDRAGTHTTEVDVVSNAAVSRVAGGAGETVVQSWRLGRTRPAATAWELVWPTAGAAAGVRAVAMARKFTFWPGAADVVAGREARVVDVYEGARLVERRALDAESGMVLRRVVFDGRGARVRMLEVERMEPVAPAERRSLAAQAAASAGAARRLRPVAAPFRAPDWLADEYQRVSVAMEGATMHAVYSDGVHEVSVFGQAGRLSTGGLPAAERVPLGRHTGSMYVSPMGEVLLWQAGGVVYTAVGDAPADELEAAAASMPGGRRAAVGTRVRRACRAVVAALTG